MANPESNESIAHRLTLTRTALGLDQTAMARSIDDSLQKWNNWERNRDRISIDGAIAMCRRHRVTLDWIYLGDRSNLPARLVEAIEKLEVGDSPPKTRAKRA